MIINLIVYSCLACTWGFAILTPIVLSFKHGMSYRETCGYRALGWSFGIIANVLNLGQDAYQHKGTGSMIWDIINVAISILLFIVFFRIWRQNRKNKKHLRKLMGAKAKALLKSVTDVMDKISEGVRQPLPTGA